MWVWFKKNLLYLAWFQALIATAGSLFFSEVMGWTPCVLCWYQRILMYPLVLILGVGILLKDKRISWYVLPLSSLGFLIAAYHNLLYYGVIQEVCREGVSCTTRFFAWFGFITIPLLSLTAFAIITTLMLIHKKEHKV
ncbi:MAG: putative disulfide formation protein [Candidatus Pacebacteria bacterium GW2011_GWB1_47_8]|nr:MAG: putative disulfide formation protein [Candidatus Pacebacteria bacterium GW2011_GWA1_46_10]KKU84162.1 MAG: putative disulfide formation protein [Candidatus Pacebacteria bacterium GW2011_GWB1_47_8]